MKTMAESICIIGGSGFYDFLSNPTELAVQTPFKSEPVVLYSDEIDGKKIFFLPRHGTGHSIPPHRINYKANIFALHLKGITRVITTSAVGSVDLSIKPGSYVILDQFIDFIRPLTYFENDFSVTFNENKQLSGVIHTDMTHPYCPDLRKYISKVLAKIPDVLSSGTYFCAAGPRFETPAEIKAVQAMGGDVVGMTNSSEAILCRELGICYSAIALVTNYAAGLQQQVNHEEVLELFNERATELKKILKDIIFSLPPEKSCSCNSHIYE
jgi:5'-methylthioadenosine phosphorylase